MNISSFIFLVLNERAPFTEPFTFPLYGLFIKWEHFLSTNEKQKKSNESNSKKGGEEKRHMPESLASKSV